MVGSAPSAIRMLISLTRSAILLAITLYMDSKNPPLPMLCFAVCHAEIDVTTVYGSSAKPSQGDFDEELIVEYLCHRHT